MLKNKLHKTLKSIRHKYSKKGSDDNKQKQIEKLTKENEELKSQMKSFFWNLCNQREKVSGNVNSLIDKLYEANRDSMRTMVKSSVLVTLERGIKPPKLDKYR